MSDLVDIDWWPHFAEQVELLLSRMDAFVREDESEVRDFGVTEESFGQIEL